MISRTRTSVRDRIVVRTRVYLAAVITGGIAAAAGLTAAAAHADDAHAGVHSEPRTDDSPARASHTDRLAPQPHTNSSRPVRPAPQAQSQTQSQPAPQGRTHSS
ncbi:hypothetical protein [Nocardioides nematodiphilus]|uniref:hypothetical protein n=1 Tax=Nocardioides nematodiphilus TaxID=2849669 RepID=UPI001CDA2DEC|nr:hypothetical protein [Nocardioides nematodiphilus]MCA1982248.1 hypothetical protein [Nocardioides nematodiphilus]